MISSCFFVVKPSEPGIPIPVKVTDNSITLNWSASPASISHYKVEMRKDGDKNTAWQVIVDHVEETTCVVEKLKHEDEVYFRVIACTTNEESEASASSEKILVEGALLFNDLCFNAVCFDRPI